MPLYRLKSGKHTGVREGKRFRLKVGDTTELTPDQLKSFGDKFELADPPQPEEPELPQLSIVQKGKSPRWFDVIDSEGVVHNEKGLSRDAAKELYDKLVSKDHDHEEE